MRGRRMLSFLVGAVLAAAGLVPLTPGKALAAGSISLSALDVAYAQDFNTLATTGTANTVLPNGWDLAESGTSTRNNSAYAASTGSDNAGDTYSFGSSASTERAYGTLLSGTLTPTIGASFTNDTGSQVTTLSVSYAGEQWRLGASGRGPDRLDLQYSLDATSLTTGTWTNADALDFSSPVTTGTVGALDGNNASNRSSVQAAIQNLAIANGATFWIRWSDFNVTSSDDGLAVDDFSLTPSFQDAAPSVTATSPQAGETGVAPAADISITFSEPVDVTEPWFTISCSDSGQHGATTAGGPTTFSLDPATDFAAGETCTVTVLAAQVADQDTVDPPDAMAGDATFAFTITDQVCGAAATPIHDVQGTGTASPIVGSAVSIEGVVVGDYQAPGQFNGYFVQEEDADTDADPATSEGIFVFNTATPVDVGDRVRVRGTVAEFSNLTELSSVTSTLICATGDSVTTTDVTLPVASIGDWERYEGMQVGIDQQLTVTEVFTLARFGEVALSVGGRLSNPTNVADPGAPALALQDLNDRSRILLDDGNNQQNIDPTFYPQGGLSAANTLRVGDSLPSLTGVLDQRFGAYRVQPVDSAAISFAHDNARTPSPADVGGNVRVASFNVLNYFNGDGAGGGFPTSRGAETLEELDRQRAKIVSAIDTLDADVIGLMELENDDPNTEHAAIEDLVEGLNAVAGAGTYAFVNTGIVGTDEIRVGILYRPAVLTPVGAYAVIDSTVDPRFIDTKNRPSIAQTFALNANGARFTVVVNHLKSKGSACTDVGDPDAGDGQGNCNGTRTQAAQAIADWLNTDPTNSGDADVLLIGDMNSYAKEDPIRAFENAGYVNTVAEFVGADAYSFVFQGQSGYLDHALASPTLDAQVSGVTEWHINADEPVALDYNTNFKTPNQVTTFYAPDAYRSSDHDPVLIGLNLGAPFDFSGFFAPVRNPPALNVVRAGSVVPFQFSLGGDQGLAVLAAGSPVWVPVTCDSRMPTRAAQPALSPGDRGLSYRSTSDTYLFEWKTTKGWTGCRRFILTLTDGSVHSADFQFK